MFQFAKIAIVEGFEFLNSVVNGILGVVDLDVHVFTRVSDVCPQSLLNFFEFLPVACPEVFQI